MPGARVAIIFDNFGPYHWARVGAAARVCNLLAIEVRDSCAEHGWVRDSRTVPFQTLTLVKGGGGKKPHPRDFAKRLDEVLSAFKPQAVFLPGWSCAAAFVALEWCGLHSVRSVVMSESNSWDEKRSVFKEWVKRRLTRLYSTALVGGTTHMNYMAELGLPTERVFFGYDAVDNNYFAVGAAENRKRQTENRKQLGLPEKYFLASARFIEKKNLPTLIEAYASYRKRALKSGTGEREAEIWHLVLLGDGPLRETLDSKISTLSLHNYVHMPGFIQYDDLPGYYGLASAFIHASTTEQWGLVVNEAMASGLPVLVSDRCGSAADLVQEGVNGFTFDPCNVEQLASQMLKLSTLGSMSSPSQARMDQLSKLGEASREIISHWGCDRFAQGAQASVDKALAVNVARPTFFDRAVLQLLATRR